VVTAAEAELAVREEVAEATAEEVVVTAVITTMEEKTKTE
jgi:hypothetical protein